MKKTSLFGVASLLAATLMGAANVSAAGKISIDPKQQLPDPDTQPAAMNKPTTTISRIGSSGALKKLTALDRPNLIAAERGTFSSRAACRAVEQPWMPPPIT